MMQVLVLALVLPVAQRVPQLDMPVVVELQSQ
jgi:hypothetical protein